MLHAATVFLGALLLFVAEPMVAKMLLPLFGGSAAVWIAALLFFQTALLGGYAYADLISRRLSPRAQAVVHSALLALGLLCVPLAPAVRVHAWLSWAPPTAQVLGVLTATIGLPYLALSATGPLVQAFWARSTGGSPYRLYALSNLGSMLGLLAYPALIEPLVGLRLQGIGWSAAFCAFGVLCAALAFRSAQALSALSPEEGRKQSQTGGTGTQTAGGTQTASDTQAANDAQTGPAEARADWLWWLILPLLSSALLSAVTIDLTLNVAPIPLLWVLPLAAYLLSFILCFESDRFYRRGLFLPAAAVALAFLGWRARSPLRGEHIAWELGSSIAAFFLVAIALHGQLVLRKPRPERLTRFYLFIAVGGALGGLFVAVGAPLLFRTDLELAVIVLCSAAALAALLWRERPVIGPLPVQRVMRAVLILFVVLLAGKLALDEAGVRKVAIDYARGFYGPVRVEDEPAARQEDGRLRKLVHGATVHGTQRLAPGRSGEPTGYYGPKSGVALALTALQRSSPSLHVGVIGLGAGVLASYCRPGDRFTFYEIDPLIDRMARQHFAFLSGCSDEVVLGDARLTLAEGGPRNFDALILDAFSGDAVPVHLLTTEAFTLFAKQLKPGGILSLHVSNRFLDLEPVVAAAAAQLGRVAYVVEDEGDSNRDLYITRWTIVLESEAQLDRLGLKGGQAKRITAPARFRPWTDDFSNLVALIR